MGDRSKVVKSYRELTMTMKDDEGRVYTVGIDHGGRASESVLVVYLDEPPGETTADEVWKDLRERMPELRNGHEVIDAEYETLAPTVDELVKAFEAQTTSLVPSATYSWPGRKR
jgi:hypothetical protein